jgi:hypothetical protein
MKAYYAMHTFSVRLCENIKMQQKTTYGGEGLQQDITLQLIKGNNYLSNGKYVKKL